MVSFYIERRELGLRLNENPVLTWCVGAGLALRTLYKTAEKSSIWLEMRLVH